MISIRLDFNFLLNLVLHITLLKHLLANNLKSTHKGSFFVSNHIHISESPFTQTFTYLNVLYFTLQSPFNVFFVV